MITSEYTNCRFDASIKPVVAIESGETVVLETKDCFSNLMKNGVWSPTNPLNENPATGPIFIKGVHKGGMLKIEVLKIETEDFGVVELKKDSGCLGHNLTKNKARIVYIEKGMAVLSGDIKIPVKPMIGVIGTAPSFITPMTMLPGHHGGNMDCARITEGSTVYLPVFTEGGLVSVGDLHAAMGDGEIGVTGLEIPGRVALRITALNALDLDFPVVKHDGKINVIASSVTLDEACEEASRQLYKILTAYCGMSAEDAITLITLASNIFECQMVNPLKTVGISLSDDYFENYFI